MTTLAPFKPRIAAEYTSAMINYNIAKNSRLSNFNPGSRARTLIDAIANQLERSDGEVARGFKDIINGVYQAFGFGRLPGVPATGYVRLESSTHTVPIVITQGTVIDLFGLEFETLVTRTLGVGDTSIDIDVRAKKAGTEYNIEIAKVDTSEGLGTITPSVPSGTRIWNPIKFSGGTNIESEEARLRRFQSFINSLGRSTLRGIKFAVESIPGVVGCVVEQNVNPYTRLPELGWINIFVSDGTAFPPATLLNLVEKTVVGDVNDEINFPGYAAAGTFVYVAPVSVSAINVELSIVVQEGSALTDDDTRIIIENAIASYINTLPLGRDVLFDTLRSRILTAHPDFYIVSLTNPSVDISIPFSTLPRVGGSSGGTITINILPRMVPT
ncbi:baseplate J/gp47 family protein [Leptospira levettii]|uniref:baseplate J/gp47 family protein n=1 Tax=Leptospira levettii TaxID=2023178 RepID=UPI000C2A3EF3|nr:baseplate J/gp47 family protein [Leptospira levettii]PJZ89541.1 hypothetical protein CH368_06170 [Leptospira levettii]